MKLKGPEIVLLILAVWAAASSIFLHSTLLHYVQSAEASHGIDYELEDLILEKEGDEGEITIFLKCTNPSSLSLKTFQIRYLIYLNGRFVKSDALYVTHTLPPGETIIKFAGHIHEYPMEYVFEAEEYGKMIWMVQFEIILELPFRGLRLKTVAEEYWVME